jgi:hypothetical protein
LYVRPKGKNAFCFCFKTNSEDNMNSKELMGPIDLADLCTKSKQRLRQLYHNPRTRLKIQIDSYEFGICRRYEMTSPTGVEVRAPGSDNKLFVCKFE